MDNTLVVVNIEVYNKYGYNKVKIQGGNSMKLSWCTIIVEDMDTSVKFYEEVVGLSVIQRFKSTEKMEIVFLGEGDAKIELISSETGKPSNVGNDISLGFVVDSLDDKLADVKEKGIEIHSGPIQPNERIKFFFIKDPNGVKVQFAQNL